MSTGGDRTPFTAWRPRASTRRSRGGRYRRAVRTELLTPEQVGLAEHGWSGETPLWIYVLKEADALHDGERLGPVGGRIVGEVLVGKPEYAGST